jgi:hypothetical protein
MASTGDVWTGRYEKRRGIRNLKSDAAPAEMGRMFQGDHSPEGLTLRFNGFFRGVSAVFRMGRNFPFGEADQ